MSLKIHGIAYDGHCSLYINHHDHQTDRQKVYRPGQRQNSI